MRTESHGDHDNCVWECKNKDCRTVYSERPETWKCQAPGCDVECCGEIGCKRNCAICDQVFCHEHSVLRNGEPVCADCLIELVARCCDSRQETRQ